MLYLILNFTMECMLFVARSSPASAPPLTVAIWTWSSNIHPLMSVHYVFNFMDFFFFIMTVLSLQTGHYSVSLSKLLWELYNRGKIFRKVPGHKAYPNCISCIIITVIICTSAIIIKYSFLRVSSLVLLCVQITLCS